MINTSTKHTDTEAQKTNDQVNEVIYSSEITLTQAINLPMKYQLRFRKNHLFSSRKLFVVQLCVEKCFEAIGAGYRYWSEHEAHNPSAAADVKEIDFHKNQNIYKHKER